MSSRNKPIKPSRIIDREILIDKDVAVPMLDGHFLCCNVFRPSKPGRYPPLIAFTPYGKDSDVAVDFKRYWDGVLRDHPEVTSGGSSGKYLTWEVPDPERWIPDGFAIVAVDARGTGKSPGYYDQLSALQTRDVYDVIEWAGRQEWSNGSVGMLGVSYLAIKQWQVAALHPPSLKAIAPWEGFFDHYRDYHRHGGIFSNDFIKLLWDTQIDVNQHGNGDSPYIDRFTGTRSTGGPVLSRDLLNGNVFNIYRSAVEHPLDDEFFRLRTPIPERIEIPTLSAGNWGGLGLHLRGNVWGFERIASKQKWLEMHTDTHFASMYLPEAVDIQKRFFAHFLKGEKNGWEENPRVMLTVRDPRGFYRRTEPEWPLSGTAWTRYYLEPLTRMLSSTQPGTEASASFQARQLELDFTTEPFAEDTEFTGHVFAKLFVSSSTADADLFLTLRLFDSEGNEVTFKGANDPQAPVSQGWLRVSHRQLDPELSTHWRPYHSHTEIEKLTPGEIYEVDVEIMPTSVVCPKGYSLVLTVGGADFARPGATGLMKGSGLFTHSDTSDRPTPEFSGTTTIHSGPNIQSFLQLPRIPAR